MDARVKLLGGAVVSLLLGGALMYLFVVSSRVDRRVRAWPTAPGIILESSLERTSIGRTGGSATPRTMKPGWRLEVSYSYALGGTEYKGDTLSNIPLTSRDRSDGGGAEAWLRDLSDRYAAGTPVQVHYDPMAPERSYLEFRPTGGRRLLLGGSIAMVVLAILLVVLQLRR